MAQAIDEQILVWTPKWSSMREGCKDQWVNRQAESISEDEQVILQLQYRQIRRDPHPRIVALTIIFHYIQICTNGFFKSQDI